MTNGQIAQLQDLSKCWMHKFTTTWVADMLAVEKVEPMRIQKPTKKYIRYLTHQYRHQIAAMRKNKAKK